MKRPPKRFERNRMNQFSEPFRWRLRPSTYSAGEAMVDHLAISFDARQKLGVGVESSCSAELAIPSALLTRQAPLHLLSPFAEVAEADTDLEVELQFGSPDFAELHALANPRIVDVDDLEAERTGFAGTTHGYLLSVRAK